MSGVASRWKGDRRGGVELEVPAIGIRRETPPHDVGNSRNSASRMGTRKKLEQFPLSERGAR